MSKKAKVVALPLDKARIFRVGEAGETHTENYTTKDLHESPVFELLAGIIPTNEIWCFSVNEDDVLEICRLVDIDFLALKSRTKR